MALLEVKLPDIGEGVTEGELVKWLVNLGDQVVADQPVAEVLTDKATVEIPTPVAGVVKKYLRQEGDVVPIETGILTVETNHSGGAVATSVMTPSHSSPSVASAQSKEQVTPAVKGSSSDREKVPLASPLSPPVADFKTLATPATRRLAREMNVDINAISGSGPMGRVTREDVLKTTPSVEGMVSNGINESYQERSQVRVSGEKNQEERVPLRGIRKKIAENLQLAKQIVPHFTLMEEVNVTELVQLRSQAKSFGEKQGVKITYLPIIMKALTATLRDFPMFNASIDDQASEIVYKKYFNLGFAADTPNGLLVPVIKNVENKNIVQLSREIAEKAQLAREGKLPLEGMKGATITITNIGSVGGVYATPIINHPEVAILGMYKVSEKPLWQEGKWQPAQFMNFTITCDHRLIDGAVAAHFMKAFARRVENPTQLMLEMV